MGDSVRRTKPLPAESPERNRTRSGLSASYFLRRYGNEFFLYEKMGRRAIDHEGSTSGEETKIPHPHTPKNHGNPRGFRSPMRRQRRIAERETASRGLPAGVSVPSPSSYPGLPGRGGRPERPGTSGPDRRFCGPGRLQRTLLPPCRPVNPFDQPGVEAYKKNMFALLGKPGYEDLRKELLAKL